MRTMMFTKETNIPHFCNQLRLVVGELFGITDAAIVEKMAINDVMAKFDSTIREPLRMLLGQNTPSWSSPGKWDFCL